MRATQFQAYGRSYYFHKRQQQKKGSREAPLPLRPWKDLQKDLLSWTCTVRGRLPKPG